MSLTRVSEHFIYMIRIETGIAAGVFGIWEAEVYSPGHTGSYSWEGLEAQQAFMEIHLWAKQGANSGTEGVQSPERSLDGRGPPKRGLSKCLLKDTRAGTPLKIQWLRLRASKARVRFWSLVAELSSHMLCGVAKKKKKTLQCYHVILGILCFPEFLESSNVIAGYWRKVFPEFLESSNVIAGYWRKVNRMPNNTCGDLLKRIAPR